MGSVGDSYDNALAETINYLYRAEVIHRRGPWRSFEAVEYATLEWSTGSTKGDYSRRSATSRLRKQRRNTTPCWTDARWQHNSSQLVSGNPGAVQLFAMGSFDVGEFSFFCWISTETA